MLLMVMKHEDLSNIITRGCNVSYKVIG